MYFKYLYFFFFLSHLTIKGIQSSLTRTPSDVVVSVSESFRLNCSTDLADSNDENTAVLWTFENSSLLVKVFENNETYPNFIPIFDVTRSYPPGQYDLMTKTSATMNECGTYTCYDNNGGSTLEFSSATVTVFDSLLCVSNVMSTVVDFNDVVTLTCSWTYCGPFNGQLTLTQDSTNVATSSNKTTAMWTTHASNIITNSVNCSPSTISEVQVNCPAVEVKPGNTSVVPLKSSYNVGDTIKCSAIANPSATYRWTNNITSDVVNDAEITITMNMAGPIQLTCAANNKYDTATTSVKSTVYVGVYNVAISPTQNEFSVGDTLHCTASGFPIPSVQWINVNNSQVTPGYLLNITSDMLGNSYQYVCNATNSFNNSDHTDSLTISFVVVQVTTTTLEVTTDVGSSTESDSGSSGSDSFPVAIVAGVVGGIGGALLITALVILAVYCYRRRKHERKSGESKDVRSENVHADQQLYTEVNKTKGADIKRTGYGRNDVPDTLPIAMSDNGPIYDPINVVRVVPPPNDVHRQQPAGTSEPVIYAPIDHTLAANGSR
jgi:hypothetical protein